MKRKLTLFGWLGLCASAALVLSSSCAEGGRVIGQRTFLWHAGDAAENAFPLTVANPFRGRVAPTKPRVGTFQGVPGIGLALVFEDDPAATRYFDGDPTTPLGFPVDPLDPAIDQILNANDTTWVGLIEAGQPFFPTDTNLVLPGIQPLLLNTTLPVDFGGDFSGEVFCVDPFSNDAIQILMGIFVPQSSSRCIRGSVDVGPDGLPNTADDMLVTAPSIVRMIGGVAEEPFRPAPDRSNLLDPATNDGVTAQGLFYPTRGMRGGTGMDYERNVDPVTGRPLVARTGSQDIGSCDSAGEISGFFVTSVHPSAVIASYSTAYASHPASVTTGVLIDNPTFGTMARGGIGTDPGCLRPGGAPGFANALLDFADDIDDDLANTNALHNHHANQSLFASLCTETRSFDFPGGANGCALTVFNDSSAFLPQLLTVPLAELLAITLGGSQAGGGAPNFMNAVLGFQKADEADTTPPLVSLNALFNDPEAPLYDRNGLGGAPGLGAGDDVNCGSGSTPAQQKLCDLAGFDGFDGRVALLTAPPLADLRPDGRQKVFQTLDNSLTNEQRGLAGCGPLFGKRCDSSSNVNPIQNPLVPGPVDPVPKYFAAAGGLDPLNGEASALFESVRAPSDAVTTTSDDAQPGTVDFANELLCMRRLAGGQLVRLPGCRGVNSYSIVEDVSGEPIRVDVEFDAGYLPSVDGCVIGSQIQRSGGGIVDVVAVGASAQLLAELPLCDGAEREQAVPGFLLTGFSADAFPEPILAANPDCTGIKDGAFFGSSEPGTPMVGSPGVSVVGDLDFEVCESELVTLDVAPMIHPLAGCEQSDVWFEARADNVASDTGLPFGGCEYFHQRDLVEEFLDGTAQLFRSEAAALSWNLVTWLAATSCDERTPDPDGMTHQQPPPGSVPPFPFGAIGGLRADPQCFDAERPFTPGRCSYASPQLCKNVIAWLGLAPPLQADGGTGDDDGDGSTLDGDGSGVAGDTPCGTGQVIGCDDNCGDVSNPGQVNSNRGDGAGEDSFGNGCDPDLDNDGDVDMTDRMLQDECFLTGASSTIDCADADLVGTSLTDGPNPDATEVDGYDRLQLLRWLRDPTSVPGSAP